MARLTLGKEPEVLRDDWIEIDGEEFQLLADIPIHVVDAWMFAKPSVPARMALVRGCLRTADLKRFDEAVKTANLSRERSQEIQDFVSEVYSNRPPTKPAGSSNGSGGRKTGSKADSTSPEPVSTPSTSGGE